MSILQPIGPSIGLSVCPSAKVKKLENEYSPEDGAGGTNRWMNGRMDGQIPPVFYRTLSPLGPLPCSPSTKITCYSSKARVPLTTYCLWAAISITFSFQHIHFVKMFFFSPFSFNCFFHTIQFSCPILCESNFLVSFVAQSENFSQHSCSCL